MPAQSAKDYLKSEQRRVIGEANSITDKADAEGRSLAPEEKAAVAELLKKNDEMQTRVDELEENARIRDSIEAAQGPLNQPPEPAAVSAKSVGDALVKSERFQHLKSANVFGAANWTTGPIELPDFDVKATLTSSTSDVVQPNVVPGLLEIRRQRPTVADLLSTGTTTSSSVRYIIQQTNTNAAAAVSEGNDKPEGTIDLQEVDESVRKIAEVLTITDEMLEDVGALRSFADNQLRSHLLTTEEAELLDGSGSAPHIRGLLNRSGILTQALGSLTAPDAIYSAITKIRVNYFGEPNGIVIHPSNWADIRLGKDDNDQYYGGGPFTGPYGNNGIAADSLWGLPVIVTTAMRHDVALVGAFQSATLFRRSGVTISASNEHSDYFKKNLTMLRIEERIALAVPYPAAFCAVTGLAEIAS